jgi:purine-binding chemotaxis protein CheW
MSEPRRPEAGTWDALLGGGALPLATEDSYRQGLAARPEAPSRRFLTFRVAAESYALDILRISEIIKARPPTEVPRAPAFVAGIISVRGTIVPVVDLRVRLRHEAAPVGGRGRILIVHHRDEPYGLVVDEVLHVVRLTAAEVEPPPSVIGGADAEFVSGIGRPAGGAARILIVLNLDAVLAFEVGQAAGGAR